MAGILSFSKARYAFIVTTVFAVFFCQKVAAAGPAPAASPTANPNQEEKKKKSSWNVSIAASKSNADIVWAKDYAGGNWDDSENWAEKMLPNSTTKTLINTKATTARVVINTTSSAGPYRTKILHLGGMKEGLKVSPEVYGVKLGTYGFKLAGAGNLDLEKGGRLDVGEMSVSRVRSSLADVRVTGKNSQLMAEKFNVAYGEGNDPIIAETPFGDLGSVFRGVMGVFHTAASTISEKTSNNAEAAQKSIDNTFAQVDENVSGASQRLLSFFYNAGKGFVTVSNGGSILSTESAVGVNGWGIGQVRVADPGSIWDNSKGPLIVGQTGVGVIDIVKGGELESGAQSLVGAALRGVGTVKVSDAGSIWNSAYSVTIGDRGNGSLILADGGVAQFTNEGTLIPLILAYSSGSQGTLQFGDGAMTGVLTASRVEVGEGAARIVFKHNEEGYRLGSYSLNADGSNFSLEQIGVGSTIFDRNILKSTGHLLVRNGTFQFGELTGDAKLLSFDNQNDQSIVIGSKEKDKGILLISPGSSITSQGGMVVGDEANSSGSVKILGQLSLERSLRLGNKGTGELSVENGGILKTKIVTFGGVGSSLTLKTGGVMDVAEVAGSQSGTLVFDRSDTYSVPFLIMHPNVTSIGAGKILFDRVHGTGHINKLTVSDGTMAFSGPGSIYISESLSIADAKESEGILEMSGGVDYNNMGRLDIASGLQSKGTLTITGAGTQLRGVNDEMIVGFLGTGKLVVKNGAGASGENAFVGLKRSSFGEMLVNGSGSTLKLSNLTIGKQGNGSVEVNDGGFLSASNRIVLGDNKESRNAFLKISGSGSAVTAREVALMGGESEIQVTGAGSFAADQLFLYDYTGGNSSLLVSGTDSKGSANRLLVMAGSGYKASVRVESGAKLTTSRAALDNNGIARPNSYSEAKVTGAGSLWNVSEDLTLIAASRVFVVEGGKLSAPNIYMRGGALLQIGENNSAPGMITSDWIRGDFGYSTIRFDHNAAAFEYNIRTTGNIGIEHVGSGMTILSGIQSYNGDTVVKNGSLKLNTNLTSAFGKIFVKNGATLLGNTDSQTQKLIVETGGRVSPGNSPGAMTFGDITLEDGAILDWDATAAAADILAAAGDLELNGIINISGDAANIDGRQLLSYGGSLIDRKLEVNRVSDPTLNRANLTLDTSSNGEVRLALDMSVVIQDWQGSDGAEWNTTNTNWAQGGGGETWQSTVGTFGGAAGLTVNLTGDVQFKEIQFETSGYVIADGGGQLEMVAGSANQLWVAEDVDAEIAANITGAGDLWKTGLGTVVLSGSNNYLGDTILDTGTLSVSAEENLGVSSSVLRFEGGALRTTESFAMNRQSVFGSDGGIFEVADGTQLTINGLISGVGELEQRGEGELVLTNDNTYAGGTSLTNGVISVSRDSALGDIAGGLTFDGGTLRALADMETARATTIEEGGGAFDVVSGKTLTHVGTISGEGRLYKTGLGTLELNGETTFTGGTSILAGTLRSGLSEAFANQSLYVATDAVWELNGTRQTIAQLSGTGLIDLTGGGLTIDGIDSPSTFGGTLDGNGTVAVRGASLALSGTNTNTGGLSVTEDGLVAVAHDENLGALDSELTLDSGTLQALGSFDMQRKITLGAGGGVFVIADGDTLTSRGSLAGIGVLVKRGEGTLRLGGLNTYAGGTLVDEGILSFVSANALSGPLEIGGAAEVALAGFDQATTALLGSGDITLGGASLTVGSESISSSYAGVISGAGNLIKVGQSVLTLSGQNLFSGQTIVQGGTLLAGGENVLNPENGMTISSGASFVLNGFDQTVAWLNLSDSASISMGTGRLSVTSGDFIVSSGAATLSDGITETPGSFVKSGIGALVVNGDLNVSTTALVQAGSLIINGQLTAYDGLDVSPNAQLGGSGTIIADVVNAGTLSPGNSPGVLWIEGDFTQSDSGQLLIEAASPTNYDTLFVLGAAQLGGTLELIPYDGFEFAYGQQFSFLRASQISGEFDEILMPAGFRGRLINQGQALTVVAAPSSYTLVAETANQFNVAQALDSFIPATGGDELTVSVGLDLLTEAEYPSAFDAISPAFYESLAFMGIEQAFSQGQQMQQRFRSVLLGIQGFQQSGFDGAILTDKEQKKSYGPDGVEAKDILTPARDNKWGVWVQGNGLFAWNTTLQNLPRYNFNSGGFLGGADYRWSEIFATGVYAGYQGTYAEYDGGGSTIINGTRFGGYATYGAADGFFANTMIGGGYSAYQVSRPIQFGVIDRTARSRPDGGDFESMLNLGYNWVAGGFNWGVVGTGQYTYLGIAPFTENGADSLDLAVDQQNANSLRTLLGGQVAYTWEVTSEFLIIPQASLYWQHEFLQNSRNIGASLDGGSGPSFDYSTAVPGRDAVYAGAGLTAQFGERWNANVYYNANFGRQDFVSHMITTGLEFRW